MKHKRFLQSIAVLLLAQTLALVGVYADVAPTEFIGSSIAPKEDSIIRMEKAKVEIIWGTPCILTAEFKMVNPSSSPRALGVGFPMPVGDIELFEMSKRAPDPLSISFDGVDAVVTPPTTAKEDRDERNEWVWFHCAHVFQPGTTTVVVKTVLLASGVYATPFHESLFYCIETGGKWAGNIGEEEITIRFPDPIAQNQVTTAAPDKYRVDGNCVHWRFENIKPKGKEYDIALTYVRPDTIKFISSLRDEVRNNPKSSLAKIRLAKHLLALGNVKSNSGFPPQKLKKESFLAIRSRITGGKERKQFENFYRELSDGMFGSESTEWTKERIAMVQILADAGYRDERSETPFIKEGEALLLDVLKHEAKNAEAWNVYLASYWRFSFAAIGSWGGVTNLNTNQANVIKTAAENCPTDECIGLWQNIVKKKPAARDTTELMKAIERHKYMVLDFPNFDRDYY